MGRPFAMWVDQSQATSVQGPQVVLRGVVLGRGPERGDRFRVIAPLCPQLRLRCRSIVGAPRGAPSSSVSVGIDPVPGLDSESLAGAVVAEDGCDVVAYSARLRRRTDPFTDAARFAFGTDHAWGLVRVTGDALNVVIVGGGLPLEGFWSALSAVQPQVHDALSMSDLEPLREGATDVRGWCLPVVTSYERDAESVGLVTRRAGPVKVRSATVYVDDDWRSANVYEHRNGVPQFLITRGPAMDTSSIALPVRSAA